MTVVVEIKEVHKNFGSHTVIAGLNLTIQQGETLGVLGPSGIGKSTLLRMIAGLEKPDLGSIHLHSRHIGYVFQEARLLPWDTALNNVVLPLRAQGMAKKQAVEQARYFLDRMALSASEHLYPHELSGGMCQRVSLARAFAISPDILLLDEPFTGLDIKLKDEIRHLLETVLEQRRPAVLHVTHDPEELLKSTDRIIYLKQHQV